MFVLKILIKGTLCNLWPSSG